MKKVFIIPIAALAVAIALMSEAQAPPGGAQVLQIRKLMGPSEFKACGLEKLSPEELKRLDTWLELYTMRVVKVLGETSAGPTPDVIESYIDGEFEGWEGETIFKLDNGQIWQQSSYAYTYHYAYRPEVLIYKTRGGYKMKVEGVADTIFVKRIK